MTITERYRRYFYQVYAYEWKGKRRLLIHNGHTTVDLQQETIGM